MAFLGRSLLSSWCLIVSTILVVMVVSCGSPDEVEERQNDEEDNQHRDETCEPNSCEALAVECGIHFDGCDDTVDCGGCDAESLCVEGACVEQTVCEPLTCDDLGYECGEHTDGCGDIVHCGGCDGEATCSEGFCVQEPPPQKKAVFNYPDQEQGEPDERLEEELKKLLELAEPDSSVHASVYTWSRSTMVDAFVDAHHRGVFVHLILGSDSSAVQTLKEELPDGRVLVCRRDGEPSGCHGGPINHNKFFLFSELSDGSRNVVVQSSANLTNPQVNTSNNTLVVIREDRALYEAYRHYWHDLSRDIDDLHYGWSAEGSTGTKAYFFPRRWGDSATGEGDPVYDVFDDIDCAQGADVHIGQARWSWARRGIAHKAAELQQQGCSVHVLVRYDFVADGIVDILDEGGVPVTFYPYIHSKYFLIDGVYRGEQRQVVWTGAMNFTSPGLRSNDEAAIKIEDPVIYEAYLQDWEKLSSDPAAH